MAEEPSTPPEITQLLGEWQAGNVHARDRLFELVQPELRRMAEAAARRERPDHTLDAPALVNELYLRFSASRRLAVQDRVHFFAIASSTMRRILIDYARARVADKRGGGAKRVTLTVVEGWAPAQSMDDVLALEQALARLEQLEPRLAKVVELRFFGGLVESEVASALGVSTITVKRDWKVARAWLLSRLRDTRP